MKPLGKRALTRRFPTDIESSGIAPKINWEKTSVKILILENG
jgi:hypothetical protein